jgi:hypothetical protein
MPRHEGLKETVRSYLAGLPDAEDRAEAAYQATIAYTELLDSMGALAAPGEKMSFAPATDQALEHTIRASNYKRKVTRTLDPADPDVRDRHRRTS